MTVTSAAVAVQETDDDDLVTVVVPARDEEDHIGSCLDSVLTQGVARLQVVVVDGGSKDRTDEVVTAISERDPRVELIRCPPQPIPTSMNVGLAAARGRWLVRVDAHSTIAPGYIERAVRRLEEQRWGGVGGRKDGSGQTACGRAIAAAMASRFGVGGSTYHYGTKVQEVEHIPFGAYPVAVARELGGWDERLRVNQDFEFDYRVRLSGRPLLFDPALTIRWQSRQTIPDLFAQYRRYGQGKVAVALLHPRSLRLRHLAPPALVAYGVASSLLALRRPGRALAMIAPYGVAVAAASATTAHRLERADRRWVPLAFLAMHVGWGAGFWIGLASKLGATVRQGGSRR